MKLKLHNVAQIKLTATITSFIGEGMYFPTSIVIKEATFKGNKQYPSMHAL